MSNLCDNDVIDLTNSFTLVDHNNLNDIVIDLVTDPDDSIVDTTEFLFQSNSRSTSSMLNCSTISCELLTSPPIEIISKNSAKLKQSSIPIKKNNNKRTSINNQKNNSSKFGECPICLDELGKNPLASTKCGHVYCLKCLENALRKAKKCPSCRHILRGSSAYHPLYIAKH